MIITECGEPTRHVGSKLFKDNNSHLKYHMGHPSDQREWNDGISVIYLLLMRCSPYKTCLSSRLWDWPRRPQHHRRKWSPGQKEFVIPSLSEVKLLDLSIPSTPNRFRAFHLTCTTPAGLTPIITQIPLKAESFSSLSLMFLNDVHLKRKKILILDLL